MKSEKHLLKRKEIIDTAFRVWNKNCYISTSLNDLADSLGMTKQAIYRYFRGKDDLLNAMESQVLLEYNEINAQINKKIETLSRDSAVEQYVMKQISFFRKNSEYLTFLISKTRSKDLNDKEFRKKQRNQNEYLSEKLSIPLMAVNYILNLVVFYTLLGERENIQTLTENICNIALNGFGTKLLLPPKKKDEILKSLRIKSGEKLDQDKVLQAVSDAVLEDGLQATMGAIAKKAGMTKSSLYFYFKNKEEMIDQAINTQTEAFVDYYYKSISAFDQVSEQLFAHFTISASVAIELPKTIPMIHWFITRGLAENLKKPTDYPNYRIFFDKAIEHNYIHTHGISADKLIMLVNFCITFEINNIERKNLSKEEKYKLVNGLYKLFTHGLKG